MSLFLEIEFLSGVSFAAKGPDGEAVDWPPQPDRVFSALVATWAARGQRPTEAEALEWLEGLPHPGILAPAAEPRTSVVSFVPPNDSRSDKQKSVRDVFPAMRSRQARRFPAARPHEPMMRFVWEGVVPEDAMFEALQGLASGTSYVGHSASLTRCRFVRANERAADISPTKPSQVVYSGRLAELRRRFEASLRPLPGDWVNEEDQATSERNNVFDRQWLVLEDVTGNLPDLRACAVVAMAIREAIAATYTQVGLPHIPEEITGKTADGRPSHSPHMAIVPLAFTGFPHADGNVLGYALIPPHQSPVLGDDGFRKALRRLAPWHDGRNRRIMTITVGAGKSAALTLELAPTLEAGRRSLDPALYLTSAEVFATVTPIALDRHLKAKGEARDSEVLAQISAACRNIGLPEPELIVIDKHSTFIGAPSAIPSGHSPSWMRWRLPKWLGSRPLVHAIIRFSSPVEGPVILGAGRHIGLGLCRPVGEDLG